jgi:hypothetical protein
MVISKPPAFAGVLVELDEYGGNARKAVRMRQLSVTSS